MLNFEERKQLLAAALREVSADELFQELCSVEAVGPTISQFLGKVPRYVTLESSCSEQTLSVTKPIKVTNSLGTSVNTIFREVCFQDAEFTWAA